LEPSCLAALAIRSDRAFDSWNTLGTVEKLQNDDGSWPASVGDDRKGCWVTALATVTLMAFRQEDERQRGTVQWLIQAKGREAKTGSGAGISNAR